MGGLVSHTHPSCRNDGVEGEAGNSGLQYMHMGMLERLPNGSLALAFQASPTNYEVRHCKLTSA